MDVFSYLLGKKSGGGGTMYPDWTQIGYNEVPEGIIEAYNYAKDIYDNWDNTITTMYPNSVGKYNNDKQLVIFPLVDTSNVTIFRNAFYNSGLIDCANINTSNGTRFGYMFYSTNIVTAPNLDLGKAESGGSPGYGLQNMFANCNALQNVPVYSPKTGTSMQSMFSNCPNLTNESLNNIMKTCINRGGTLQTLKFIGLTQDQATTCTTLSNYQDYVAAGGSTGY